MCRSADELTIARSGEALFDALGVDMDAVHRSTRPAARACLDWTERRHHLAGAAGAALFDALLGHGWLTRGSRPCSICLTAAGQHGLRSLLEI